MKYPLISKSKQSSIQTWIAVAVVGGITLSPIAGRADDQTELIEKLLNRIEQLEKKVETLESGRASTASSTKPADAATLEALDQKVRVLEQRRERDIEDAAAKAKVAPQVSIGQNGFVLRSADTNFGLKIKGVVQLDSRTFFKDNPISEGNNSFLLRRARPILEGTVFRDFDFQFVPDFGGSSVQIFDAWLNYRYRPELQFRFGKFKSPIGLEQLQSDVNVSFNERSLATDLVPNRDLGVQFHGEAFGGVLSYAAGVFNGVGDARNSPNADFDDDKEFVGRLFVQPFKKSGGAALRGLGFGLSGSYSDVSSNATGLPNNNGFATDGQQQFFVYTNGVVANGEHWRLSPQGYYYYGPFGLLGEYVISHQSVQRSGVSRGLDNRAWQLSGQWVLTGEDASYAGVVPRRPFDPRSNGWGAWQFVARYAELDVDDAAFPVFANPAASASAASAWSVGLNWWLNQNVRVMSSFSHTRFDGGGTGTSVPATVTHQAENVLFTRVQLGF